MKAVSGVKAYNRKRLFLIINCFLLCILALISNLVYIMVINSAGYAEAAQKLHERERSIKAERGIIYDRNGVVLASNKSVSTISVIHNQITEPELVIEKLSSILGMSEETVRKRVEKYSSIERIKTNVPKETADEIRNLMLDGVMVDEDYKRYYPYGSLASKVIGFTGSDNQGIIGLEVYYDSYLQGEEGMILTLTTAHGLEIDGAAEGRIEPVPGNSIRTSLDVNIQKYAEQIAYNVLEAKKAKRVSIICMNPSNGEIYAMVNAPEFDLNSPFVLSDVVLNEYTESELTDAKKNELLNEMWRNTVISDTYEPGSTFKIVTATAAFEKGVVNLNDSFFCPGHRIVADRTIHCHKVAGHGAETFVEGIMNSCNPVFMDIGARVGAEDFYYYMDKMGLFTKTGIDLPGEAGTIAHKLENVGEVELATMSFGQSFQITPLQLMVAASAVANGGNLVTPHFGISLINYEGNAVKEFEYTTKENVISKETSETMKYLLEKVVSEGTGKNAYIAGYKIAGKTATSEKLPRSQNKYISSFIGFAPADEPRIITLVMIDEPEGIYYGGTIAAPMVAELYENILPYLEIAPAYTEQEIEDFDIGEFEVPDVMGMSREEVKKLLKAYPFDAVYYLGEGSLIIEQFPLPEEKVKKNSDLILYFE